MMRGRLVVVSAVVLAAAFAAACETVPEKARILTVNGVHLVENPPRAAAPIVFRLGDSVLRDIGGLKEYDEDEFNHRSGFLTGVSFSDGGLAVIDWTKVRIFDAAGAQTAVVGRNGSGPGEFRGLMRLCRTRGDTLIAFDGNLRRITIFARNGFMIRQFETPLNGFQNDGCFNDGTFTTQMVLRPTGDEVPLTAALHLDLNGKVFDSIGVFPSMSFRGVSQYASLVVRGPSLYISDPRKNEVRRFDATGKLTGIIRMADKPRAMTADEATRWLGGPVAAAGSAGSAAPTATPAAGAATWPFYRGILVDSDQRLWVRDFPADDSAPERWTAYDSAGLVIGALDLPRGPVRTMMNPQTRQSETIPGMPPMFIDARGNEIILLERDSDGAAHFRTRKIR